MLAKCPMLGSAGVCCKSTSADCCVLINLIDEDEHKSQDSYQIYFSDKNLALMAILYDEFL